MQITHKNWWDNHIEGIIIWTVTMGIVALAMYIGIRH